MNPASSVKMLELFLKSSLSLQKNFKVIQQVRKMSGVVPKFLSQNVWETDSELFDLIKKEKRRQLTGLEMIASENFTTLPVLQCLSSCLHNKYSEGMPGQRYVIETIKRTLITPL